MEYFVKARGEVCLVDKNSVPGLSIRTMCMLLFVRCHCYYEHHKWGEAQHQYQKGL